MMAAITPVRCFGLSHQIRLLKSAVRYCRLLQRRVFDTTIRKKGRHTPQAPLNRNLPRSKNGDRRFVDGTASLDLHFQYNHHIRNCVSSALVRPLLSLSYPHVNPPLLRNVNNAQNTKTQHRNG